MTEKVDVLSNCSNIKQHALEEIANTLSPDKSLDDISNDIQQKEGSESSKNSLSKLGTINKKNSQFFSESSSDDDEGFQQNLDSIGDVDNKSDISEENVIVFKIDKPVKHKSRIRTLSSSESDEELKNNSTENISNNYDLSRVKNRKKKLSAKFNKLLLKQNKMSSNKATSDDELSGEENTSQISENSDEELTSCDKIKKMYKKRENVVMSLICDPDVSDDEGIVKQNKKSTKKTIELTSPKPIRMSAKQAMENMQKIKSESNRMLREKEVSLPYHKPRALSLKDIMSRRKPALAPDGKTLSVKMTAEQLEQYALQLEQRQKEMMELCKSDNEDEDCAENMNKQDANDENQVTNSDSPTVENTTTIDANPNINIHTNTALTSTEPIECETNLDHVPILENVCNVEKNVEVEYCFKDSKDEKILVTKNIDESTTNDSEIIANKESRGNEDQAMELHYDSEKMSFNEMNESCQIKDTRMADPSCIDFSENDFNLDDVIAVSEDIEMSDVSHNKCKQMFETPSLKGKPQLVGSPGMVIELDVIDTSSEKKLTGVQLLKERFQYFARLKSLEEKEKDREKKYKPGVQHLKLKQELEEQIAEQRSLEWAKRMENENQQEIEPSSVQYDESDIDGIEKLEAKLEHLNDSHISKNESSDSSEEDEEIEDDCLIEDKPRKRNPMLDDEAEESDIEEDYEPKEIVDNLKNDTKTDDREDLNETEEDDDSAESDDESSESESEVANNKQKKGRILKAFEDSDDEDNPKTIENGSEKENVINNTSPNSSLKNVLNSSASQDEELQLAQVHKTSSESNVVSQDMASDFTNDNGEKALGSQSFSIINSQKDSSLNCLDKLVNEKSTCFNGDFTNQKLYLENLNSQPELNSLTVSQEIGDDIAALCTGKFYDNPLVSQCDENLQSQENVNSSIEVTQSQENEDGEKDICNEKQDNATREEKQALTSILEELNDPQFDSPNQYKYFVNDNPKDNKENISNIANIVNKKKFIIDSDDDVNDADNVENKTKKKNKRRKKEKKALQFSDDEDEFEDPNDDLEMAESDFDEDPEAEDRIVEYDSEENEVVVERPKLKKKRVAGDFFEQEAELTSEDEWIGSGDEDEHGLDRMEREEGDDEVFQEDKLRNELGQIHMRDVLDQDKREVRLLQELLFEDGDLGDGHRQRKFRWRNADDTDETTAALDEFAETQEEEFESEEQWRKQRHEREVFLKKMKGVDDEDLNNTSINRTTIIKANLCSRTMSSLLSDKSEDIEKNPIPERKPTSHKDIPSPKKPFPVFQQNYHGSLLSRGKGALARLAAIATPLAADNDDAPKASAPTNRGNFVFAALTPDEVDPKMSKRKADTALTSPGSIKKMRTDEKPTHLKSSLFDYL